MKHFAIFGLFVIWGAAGCAADVHEGASPEETGVLETEAGHDHADHAGHDHASHDQVEPAIPDGAATDYDPFAGDMPDLLVHAHLHVLSELPLEIGTMRALFNYGQSSGDDARPWLLLALDSMNQGAPGFAVRQYRSACEADPDVAAFARMRDDLVWIAIEHSGVERREAVALLSEMWGERVLPAIDELMVSFHEEGDLERVRALVSVRAELTGA